MKKIIFIAMIFAMCAPVKAAANIDMENKIDNLLDELRDQTNPAIVQILNYILSRQDLSEKDRLFFTFTKYQITGVSNPEIIESYSSLTVDELTEEVASIPK